ncbi:MAG: hypothetical protein J3R72DRAFT_419986 [Linnemannia gamsii]|nr:MAG: hypothetical protein J3R72DRAFT_419986 [Linnemannia gamsii]
MCHSDTSSQSHHQPSQRSRKATLHQKRKGLRTSQAPRELLKLVSFYLADPLDLLRFSYTCHELYFLTAPKDWYSLATCTYSHWVVSCGCADDRDWKAMVLRDAALDAQLGASLPALPITSPLQTTFSLTVALVLPSSQPVISGFHNFASFSSLPVLVKIKHHPGAIEKANMRVVIVTAFGQQARPPVNSATDSHTLGVWLMLKVIEVWIPAHPWAVLTTSMMKDFRYGPSIDEMAFRSCIRINPDHVVDFESLEPRRNQITMYGRVVKLYSADAPSQPTGDQKTDSMKVDSRGKADCIVIFGIQNSDMASAKSRSELYDSVSCMTLFPDHIDFEHLLLLFNQHGRGMDWY